MSLIAGFDGYMVAALREQVTAGTPTLGAACRAALGQSCGDLDRAVGPCLLRRLQAGDSFGAYYECAACVVRPGPYPAHLVPLVTELALESGTFPLLLGDRGRTWADQDAINEYNVLPDEVRKRMGAALRSGYTLDAALDTAWEAGCTAATDARPDRPSLSKWILGTAIAGAVVIMGPRVRSP